MRQKCSRKLYKNNEDRSQAKGEASTLKTGKLRYQPVNPRSYVYVYEGLLGMELNLSSVIRTSQRRFLFMLLKLPSAAHVDVV